MGIDSVRSVVIAAAVTLATTAAAQGQRTVIVNGERLDAAQIAWLENVACTRVPDGSYWVDSDSGAWGYGV